MAKKPLEIVESIYYRDKFDLDEKYIEKVPDTIYHYTNLASFLSITEKKQLWASRAEFLNDARGFRYGMEVCEKQMEAYETRGKAESEFVTKLREALESGTNSPFIVCFCESGDLLSQWWGYATAGQGLSLGIDSKTLSGLKSWSLNNVIYDDKQQNEFIRRQIQILGDAFISTGIDLTKDDNFMELVGYSCFIEECSILIKDDAFLEENELRLCLPDFNVGDNYTIRFRARNELIVPYLELDMANVWPDVLREIIIGPGPEPQLRRYNMEHFLDISGLEQVEVRISNCQYRG